MAACAQCRLQNRKKKCTPETRIWPQVCDYCLKAGYPCSPALSKKELENISDNERDKLLRKENLRSADEIISDLDCLLYMKSQAGHLINEMRILCKPWVSPDVLKAMDIMESASRRIDKVGAKLRDEAQKETSRLLCKGDKAKAYILSSLSTNRISYQHEDIRRDYYKQENDEGALNFHQSTLDAIAGLHFRRIKALESIYKSNDSRLAMPLEFIQITPTDIFYLYETLGRVAKLCGENFENRVSSEFGPYSNSAIFRRRLIRHIFEKLSPLSFISNYLSSSMEYGSGERVRNWREATPHGPREHAIASHELRIHLAAANYLLQQRGCDGLLEIFASVGNKHTTYILEDDHKVGNSYRFLARLTIDLRDVVALEHFLEKHRYCEVPNLLSYIASAQYNVEVRELHEFAVTQYKEETPELHKLSSVEGFGMTALTAAIVDSDRRYIIPFFTPGILRHWIGPTKVRLSSVLGPELSQILKCGDVDGGLGSGLSQIRELSQIIELSQNRKRGDLSGGLRPKLDQNLKRRDLGGDLGGDLGQEFLRPSHLAGLTKQKHLFKILFEYEKKFESAIRTVAIVAILNNDHTVFSLLARLFEVNSHARESGSFWLLRILEYYGNEYLINALLEFFDSQENLGHLKFLRTERPSLEEPICTSLDIPTNQTSDDGGIATIEPQSPNSIDVRMILGNIYSYDETMRVFKSKDGMEGSRTCSTVKSKKSKVSSGLASNNTVESINGFAFYVPRSGIHADSRNRIRVPDNDIPEVHEGVPAA